MEDLEDWLHSSSDVVGAVVRGSRLGFATKTRTKRHADHSCSGFGDSTYKGEHINMFLQTLIIRVTPSADPNLDGSASVRERTVCWRRVVQV